MKSEYRRIVAQASEEALASWILKNLDWSGGNDDANSAFLTSILLEHRRQSASAVPESGALHKLLREMVETAEDSSNSNNFLGGVFRTNLPQIKVLLSGPSTP